MTSFVLMGYNDSHIYKSRKVNSEINGTLQCYYNCVTPLQNCIFISGKLPYKLIAFEVGNERGKCVIVIYSIVCTRTSF